jgi:hypothetical protein
MAGPVHITGADREQDRLAAPGAHLHRSGGVGVKMHVMPFHLLQARLSDRIQETVGCAVIKQFGRRLGCILQIHFDGMTLIGANAQAVVTESETLFVIVRNDVLQLFDAEAYAVTVHSLEQFIHPCPAGAVELEAYAFRLVPQNEAEEFARADNVFIGHGRI